MKIAGVIEESLDYVPGAVSFVIFTQGCNFRCPYCFNPEMARFYDENAGYDERIQDILNILNEKKDRHDVVVVSGGEPTIHASLPQLLFRLKETGLTIRLETNGTNPKMLASITRLGLVDHVALDIKAPLELNKYKEISGTSLETPTLGKINQSIRVLTQTGVDYEIRTTLIKEKHSFHDILDICQTIVGCKRLCLQEYKSDIVHDETYNKFSSYQPEKLEKLIKAINPEIKEVVIKSED